MNRLFSNFMNGKNNQVSMWSILVLSVYPVAAYFISRQYPFYARVLFLSFGLFVSFFLFEKIKLYNLLIKVIILVIPLLALTLNIVRQERSIGTVMNLKGVWTARIDGVTFNLLLRDDIAYLSAEPGQKDVEYKPVIKKDSLILFDTADNQLKWRIIELDGCLFLDAGKSTLFRRRQ